MSHRYRAERRDATCQSFQELNALLPFACLGGLTFVTLQYATRLENRSPGRRYSRDLESAYLMAWIMAHELLHERASVRM